MYQYIKRKLRNEIVRHEFVENQLKMLPKGGLILDAGCGSQQYKAFCSHLVYRGQDFGQYTTDTSSGFTSDMGGESGYQYGELHYVGDVWRIDEADRTFDAVLCTEVFEHIPYPNETLQELSRLLKPGGKLILTLPSNCLRHMDPYYFYSGFSDNYLHKFLADNSMQIETLESVGDYYSWIAVELARTIKKHSVFSAVVLLPAFLWFFFKKPNQVSKNTLCMGYHVVASKINQA